MSPFEKINILLLLNVICVKAVVRFCLSKVLVTEEVGMPENTQIFINQRLYPYYENLWSKSKKFHPLGKFTVFL